MKPYGRKYNKYAKSRVTRAFGGRAKKFSYLKGTQKSWRSEQRRINRCHNYDDFR